MSFDSLIPEARAFLQALAQNNTRDWFLEHKSDYEARLKAPALHLLDEIAARLTRRTGAPVSTKLFRPHRDVRFSKDKTPYHTHLHMLWTARADSGAPTQWYFGISPDYISAGGGVMGFDKTMLSHYRAALAEHGPALLSAVNGLQALGARLSDPELKRPAPPIAPDDPLADLARRKSLRLRFEYPPEIKGLAGRLEHDFISLLPMQEALKKLLDG